MAELGLFRCLDSGPRRRDSRAPPLVLLGYRKAREGSSRRRTKGGTEEGRSVEEEWSKKQG